MNYVGSIEKQASQAWKRHFGELGEESVNRLLHSGVFDRTKELKGLRRGTKGILRSNNAKMFRSPIKASAVAAQASLDNAIANGKYIDRDTRQRLRNKLHDDTSSWGARLLNGKKISNLKLDGVVNAPKGLAGRLNDGLGYDVDLPIPGRRKREDQKWLQAILERHEADEIRTGNRLSKRKRKIIYDPMGRKVVIKPTFASHVSPDVVVREGVNTALAPKGAQKYMHELRNIGNEFGSTEKSRLKDYGIEYGKSPYVKTKDRMNVERAVKNDNMQQQLDTFNSVREYVRSYLDGLNKQ